jgi:hypothetical protein
VGELDVIIGNEQTVVGRVGGIDALRALAFEGRPLTRALATQREAKLLGHFTAQRLLHFSLNVLKVRFMLIGQVMSKMMTMNYLLVSWIVFGIVAELDDGDDNGEGQTAQQHHEHAP